MAIAWHDHVQAQRLRNEAASDRVASETTGTQRKYAGIGHGWSLVSSAQFWKLRAETRTLQWSASVLCRVVVACHFKETLDTHHHHFHHHSGVTSETLSIINFRTVRSGNETHLGVHTVQHGRTSNLSGPGLTLFTGLSIPPFPPSFLSPLSSLAPFLFSPLRSRQLGVVEHGKLPQWDLGLSPSGNHIWCVLALKSDIWWQWNQFY